MPRGRRSPRAGDSLNLAMRELTPVPGRRAGDGAGTRHSDKTAKNGAVAESRRLFEPRNPASTQAANYERSRRVLRSRHRGLPRGLSRYPEKRERTRPEQGRCFMHSTTLSPGLLRDKCDESKVKQSKANSELKAEQSKPIMILPQVHLRKPCYDFYFLQAIEFERLLGQRCRRFHARPRPIRGPH